MEWLVWLVCFIHSFIQASNAEGGVQRGLIASLSILSSSHHHRPRRHPQDCDCDMHCSKCSVELVLDASYKRRKEEKQAGMRLGDAEEDSLPVNVTSADLTVAVVSHLLFFGWSWVCHGRGLETDV